MSKKIPNKNVISFNKKYKTGHSPFLVLTDDYDNYVLKTQNNQSERDAIIKEFLCSSLLKKWNIETPDVASLTVNDEELKQDPLIINDKRFTYSNVYFGSSFRKDSLDLNHLFTGSKKLTYDELHNPGIILDIALFDIWVENDDRKPSNYNLLFCPYLEKHKILAIDHAFTFASLPFLDINNKNVSFSDNDSILNTPLATNVVRKEIININCLLQAEEKFYLCVENSKNEISSIFESFPQEFLLSEKEMEKVHSFLFSNERNKLVFDQFKYIISSIKS